MTVMFYKWLLWNVIVALFRMMNMTMVKYRVVDVTVAYWIVWHAVSAHNYTDSVNLSKGGTLVYTYSWHASCIVLATLIYEEKEQNPSYGQHFCTTICCQYHESMSIP